MAFFELAGIFSDVHVGGVGPRDKKSGLGINWFSVLYNTPCVLDMLEEVDQSLVGISHVVFLEILDVLGVNVGGYELHINVDNGFVDCVFAEEGILRYLQFQMIKSRRHGGYGRINCGGFHQRCVVLQDAIGGKGEFFIVEDQGEVAVATYPRGGT